MTSSRLLPSALILCFACNGETSELADAGVPPDETDGGPIDPPDAGPAPFACDTFDRASPGDARGRLLVLVTDGAEAVEGAVVVLEAAAVRMEASVDATGCAAFEDPSIAPPFWVHVFADGYRYESAYGARALVQTYVLDRNPLPTERALSFVEGSIPNLQLVAPALGAGQARYARVIPSIVVPGNSVPGQPRRPGDMWTTAEILEGGPFGYERYRLGLRPAARTDLLALAGVIYEVSPGLFGPMSLSHVAIAEDVALDATSTVTADLELTLALDRPLYFDTYGVPAVQGSVGVRLFYGLETARGAYLGLGAIDSIFANESALVPALEGPLRDAHYWGAALLSGSNPQRYVRSIAARTNGDILTFWRWLTELGEPIVEGRTVEVAVDLSASWCELRSWRSSAGYDWRLTRWDGTLGAFTLPEVPAGFADPATGVAAVEVRCVLEEEDWPGASRGERFLSDSAVRATVSFAL